MPLYDCLCVECGHEEEQLLGRQEATRPCERCGSDMVRRVIQRGSTFALMGSGWAGDGYSSPRGRGKR